MRLLALLLVVIAACEGTLQSPQAAAVAATADARRQLQATCTPGLKVKGKDYAFDACQDVKPPFAVNGYSLTVHTAVEPDGKGSLLRVGLSAQTKGWVGWGLDSQMMGDRVIAWTDGKGVAQVAGFTIESYLEEDVNAAQGTYKIQDAAAEAATGVMRAVFTIAQPDTPANKLTASPLDFVYALGPMGGATAPGLRMHVVYSSDSLQLAKAAALTTPANATGAPAAPTTPAKNDTAPAAEKPAAEVDASKAPAQAAPATEAAPSPAPKAAVAAAATPSPAPAVAGSCTLKLGDQAAVMAFTGCSLIDLRGAAMNLLWKAEELPSNPKKTLLTLGLSTASSEGYVSVGFPARPGQMVGANAMILQACIPGTDGCTDSGARLRQFYLGGETESAVDSAANLAVSNVQAAALASGSLVGTFSLEVDTPTSARRRRNLLAAVLQEGTNMPLIFAAGPLVGDAPAMHIGKAYDSLPVLSWGSTATNGTTTVTGSSDSENSSLKAAHGWLAAIGWGVFVPLGVVLARGFKQELSSGWWFHLHRIMQTLGFVMGTVAMGLGFAIAGEWETSSYDNMIHRNLGVACTVLGFTQFSALIFRPAPGEKYRFAWEQWHHWVGRSATVLAIANIYWGCIHMWNLGAWAWACYTAVLAAIVGVGVAKEVHNLRRAHTTSYKSFITSDGSSPTVASREHDVEVVPEMVPRSGASAKVSASNSLSKF